jgi:hypothetical protein
VEDDLNNLFIRLSKSKFRSKFKLSSKDIAYIKEKGIEVIERHARDFVESRLAPAEPKNDGKQTPMRGHPVFVAQHATATCCRGCLFKWHKIPQNRQLEADEIDYIVGVLVRWLVLSARQYGFYIDIYE